jgi:diacylglycerol kinase
MVRYLLLGRYTLKFFFKKRMRRFIKSLGYALTGIRTTFKSEQNFRIQIAAMIMAIILGFYLQISLQTWGFVIFSIGAVLVAELFNTAVEKLGDETANGKQRQRVKNAKDTSAAAVLISALTALAIGILFLIIPLIQKMIELF